MSITSIKILSHLCHLVLFLSRRMFPTVRVSFSSGGALNPYHHGPPGPFNYFINNLNGIRSERRYYVYLDVVPIDNKRYRYAYHRSSWLIAGKADPPAPKRLYLHPDSRFNGDQLRKQV